MTARVLLFVSFAFFCFSGPLRAQEKPPFVGVVKTDGVNLRAGNNSNFEILAKLPKGSEVVVTGQAYEWFKVRLPEGARAFIIRKYVDIVGPGIGEVAADRVNVRAAPDTEATILGQMNAGDLFFIQEDQGEWIWMKPVEKLSGWVHSALVAFKDGTIPPLPVPVKSAPVVNVPPVTRVKEIGDGLVSCEGRLEKAEGLDAYILVVSGEKACGLKVPAGIAEPFIGRKVTVKGRLLSPESGLPFISVTWIRLAI